MLPSATCAHPSFATWTIVLPRVPNVGGPGVEDGPDDGDAVGKLDKSTQRTAAKATIRSASRAADLMARLDGRGSLSSPSRSGASRSGRRRSDAARDVGD